MAQVYRGLHETLQREVAIKELLPHAARDLDMLSRFRREALALASFRHQNIVSAYDLVEKNGAQFLILEFVDGPTLSELLRDGPFPALVVAVIGAQLASALEHAHFHRIIHRDLKPANAMLSRTGEVKLMDFGIARDEDLGPLTKTGMAIGTPAYMSPEQVTGGAIDHRTDIYTLGVVLYECAAGQRPFTGNSPGEVFARVRDGRCKPLAKVAPRTPGSLQRIIRKAMQTEPGDRYFDASELRRELETFIASELEISEAGLLVAFLRHRNKISETDAMARLTARELEVARRFDSQSESSPVLEMETLERRSGLKWALGLLTTGGLGTLAWLHPLWLPKVHTWLTTMLPGLR
jgi:serine/threonine-protein kinase